MSNNMFLIIPVADTLQATQVAQVVEQMEIKHTALYSHQLNTAIRCLKNLIHHRNDSEEVNFSKISDVEIILSIDTLNDLLNLH